VCLRHIYSKVGHLRAYLRVSQRLQFAQDRRLCPPGGILAKVALFKRSCRNRGGS
jgi:hypothetical protein